jgi:transcription termination factor Rho
VAAEALEQSVLESKDKDQLLAIAKALGVKASTRTKKSDIIAQILETTGAAPAASTDGGGTAHGNGASNGDRATASSGPVIEIAEVELPLDIVVDPPAEVSAEVASPAHGSSEDAWSETESPGNTSAEPAAPAAPTDGTPVLGEDGEPLAEWELALRASGDEPADADGATTAARNGPRGAPNELDRDPRRQDRPAPTSADGEQQGGQTAGGQPAGGGEEGESRNRRRRRRRKGGANRGIDGPQGDDFADEVVEAPAAAAAAAPGTDIVEVAGYLDMRDEGYGFLRVKGYLPSRDDAYIPVKLARQYGLRKGDHVTGTSRPAARNEKNPALLDVLTVNGGDPDAARRRPRFEDLTALFPDERLRLEDPTDPTNMTARIIDLVAPIGKGQRGIIVSPPKAGKTTIMKAIAKSIEANNPEVRLMVLLIDERPEEVTDIRRTVKGEVIASTFDRPSDEHTHVAELAIEKAKRMVEQGEDVVVILDGITRLSRAYNLAAPASGRILSGGIDAGALYPPKKFFGAARNIEEGGSLTILATALVDTNSRMDEAIFEEFKGTGNMELRLDRRLSERRIYPAIDVDASSTRHEELLFDRKQLQMVWKLRRVLSGLAADGNAAPGLELLIDRLKTFRTNDEFLNEIAKQPSM